MTLSTNGKNWLAQNAGSGNCFTTGGVSYTDADGIARVGSTGDVVNAFYTAHSVNKDTATIIAATSYNGFRAINGGDLVMGDVGDAYGMESGATQYCYTPGGGGGDVEAIVGTFDFSAPPCTGDPAGSIAVPATKTMGIEMSQILNKTWFWINGVQLTNASACAVFTTVELRMWPGAQSSCGTKASAIKSINRNVGELFIRNIPIEAGDTSTQYLDYFITEGVAGVKKPDGTPILWANFSKYDLNYELEMEGYTNPSPE